MNGSGEEDLLEEQFRLHYRAEFSSRYHRRRANFLSRADILINVITLFAGASAFGQLIEGADGLFTRTAAAIIAVLAIVQIVFRLGKAATCHEQWMRRWSELASDIKFASEPSIAQLKEWEKIKTQLETECVNELRALTVDCENKTSAFMRIDGRQRSIGKLQRALIQIGTFQSDFPLIPGDRNEKFKADPGSRPG